MERTSRLLQVSSPRPSLCHISGLSICRRSWISPRMFLSHSRPYSDAPGGSNKLWTYLRPTNTPKTLNFDDSASHGDDTFYANNFPCIVVRNLPPGTSPRTLKQLFSLSSTVNVVKVSPLDKSRSGSKHSLGRDALVTLLNGEDLRRVMRSHQRKPFRISQHALHLHPTDSRHISKMKFTEEQCSLFVGNIPYSIPEQQIRALFEPYGTIQGLHWATTLDGSFRGHAYVNFTSAPDVQRVLELDIENPFWIGHSKLRLSAAANPQSYVEPEPHYILHFRDFKGTHRDLKRWLESYDLEVTIRYFNSRPDEPVEDRGYIVCKNVPHAEKVLKHLKRQAEYFHSSAHFDFKRRWHNFREDMRKKQP